LPVATIGPSARAGLNAAPVSAPPMMMLRVRVIPIANGARMPARPATTVLSTTVTRKKGEHGLDDEAGPRGDREGRGTQSEVLCERRRAEAGRRTAQHGPQQQRADDTANELTDDITSRIADTHGAGGEHAHSDGGVKMAARH